MDDSKTFKKGFFKKVWYSITKIEKYGEMAAEGIPRAIKYTIKLALIISAIIALGSVYQSNQLMKKGKEFIETQVGDFNYKDGILSVPKEETIIAPSSTFGQIVINTNIETNEEADNIINSIDSSKVIILLRDRVVVKGVNSKGAVIYKYADLMQGINITEINKQDLIDFLSSSDLWKLYVTIFLAITIGVLIALVLQILWYSIILAIFGFIVTFFSSIKIRFAAIFNMSCYAFTLSVLMQGLYMMVQMFTKFEVKYFIVMYIAVAAIYLIAAIFIIKSDFVKQQIEKDKNTAEKKEIEKENENKEEKKQNDKKPEEQDEEKEKDKGKKEKKDDGEAEPEGSQA